MARIFQLISGVCLIVLLGGCNVKYSLNGASIDNEATTVNVRFIENRAPQNNPTLSQRITDRLRTKILSQTRLKQTNESNASYEFKGNITGYSVSNAAVTQVDKPATARLTITVNITFVKRVGDKKGFTQSFSRSQDFNANQTLQEVESNLIESITPQLVDDIFNRAFANW
ncbi:LPS assembly lipoprotein LptE [Chitinophaga horti]|uniref:LPS assembly lipoprotein LptE n=1 Tax=Chitinophaga horti TaxID=2920382 RepID=A0ABY6IYA8_9BACT|nr:LptE family protein [Chitinophaga horti]UYQ91079.1 LPS assembly lipoprotein LptE [Chitinophaga horti]